MRTAIFLLFSITTCAFNFAIAETKLKEIKGYAQGTTFSIKFWSNNSLNIKVIDQQINNELKRLDKLISNYRNDSNIELFNQNQKINTPIAIDPEISALLKHSQTVYQLSNECYDPTIKPLFKLWGFKKKQLNIPTPQETTEALSLIGFDKIKHKDNTLTKTASGLTIDLSAIGQGYAIQQLAKLLEALNINNYLVEIGGEMLVKGEKTNHKPWLVGIERPVPNAKKISEIIRINPKESIAIITSGTYRHYYDKNGIKYSHILNPKTGQPVTHNTVSVTVLLNSATLADAWATALLCLGSEQGLSIANQLDIPAIYYDMLDNNLIRKVSNPVKGNEASWEIIND